MPAKKVKRESWADVLNDPSRQKYIRFIQMEENKVVNDPPSAKEVALRRLYTRFNTLEAEARSKGGHPSNKEHAEYYDTQAKTWALAKDLVKEEMINDGA